MKQIINIIMALFCLASINSCKKKDKPHGANIVKYKLNGVQYQVEGNYEPWSNKGIGLGVEKDGQLGFSAYPGGGEVINLVGSIKLGTNNFDSSIYDKVSKKYIVFPSIYLTHKYKINDSGGVKTLNLQCKFKSGFYSITNNSTFFSGTFSGMVYSNTNSLWAGEVDSFLITEGYFDIPKQ